MNQVVEYKVINADDVWMFLKEGWELFGGVTAVMYERHELDNSLLRVTTFYQAMVKYKPDLEKMTRSEAKEYVNKHAIKKSVKK